MSKKINVRSRWDRVRYAIIFEVLLILMSAPVIAYFLERETTAVGMLTVMVAIKALVINFIYNLNNLQLMTHHMINKSNDI